MIRGAIEVANATLVQGWLYCSFRSLGDETVLAFIGSRCIGAGKIELLREDLRAAGLGDGLAGFSFKVALPPATSAASIVVKLEGSDLLLMQRDATIESRLELVAARR